MPRYFPENFQKMAPFISAFGALGEAINASYTYASETHYSNTAGLGLIFGSAIGIFISYISTPPEFEHNPCQKKPRALIFSSKKRPKNKQSTKLESIPECKEEEEEDLNLNRVSYKTINQNT